MEVPTLRTLIFLDLNLSPPIWGNYHISQASTLGDPSNFGVRGSAPGVWDLGLGVRDSWSRAYGLGFWVQGFRFRAEGVGFEP